MALDNAADGEALHGLFLEVFALQAALARHMDALHERAGLSTPEVKTLSDLARLGRATVPDIAAHLGVSRQFVQTLSNRLQADGLVTFTDNPRHKRSRLVALTTQGQETLKRFRIAEAALIAERLPDVDGRAVAEAHALLAALRRGMEDAWLLSSQQESA